MSNSPDSPAVRQAFAALPPTIVAAEAPWPSPPPPPTSVITAGVAAAAALSSWSGDHPAALIDRHPEAGLRHCPDHGVTCESTVGEPPGRSGECAQHRSARPDLPSTD